MATDVSVFYYALFAWRRAAFSAIASFASNRVSVPAALQASAFRFAGGTANETDREHWIKYFLHRGSALDLAPRSRDP